MQVSTTLLEEHFGYRLTLEGEARGSMFLSNAGTHPRNIPWSHNPKDCCQDDKSWSYQCSCSLSCTVAHYLWTQGPTCTSSLITSPWIKHTKRGGWLQMCYSKMWPKASWPISKNYLKLLSQTLPGVRNITGCTLAESNVQWKSCNTVKHLFLSFCVKHCTYQLFSCILV